MKEEIFEALRKGATIAEIQSWFGLNNIEAFSYYCEYETLELA